MHWCALTAVKILSKATPNHAASKRIVVDLCQIRFSSMNLWSLLMAAVFTLGDEAAPNLEVDCTRY